MTADLDRIKNLAESLAGKGDVELAPDVVLDMVSELRTLRDIVISLANGPGPRPVKFIYTDWEKAEPFCAICDHALHSNIAGLAMHSESCPYRRAVEWLRRV